MSRTEWSNVQGELKLDIYRDRNELYDPDTNNEAPECLLPYVQDEDAAYELVIDFTSSGYDDSGQMYGGPDGVGVPPEGEDNRNPENAHITFSFYDVKGLNGKVIPAKAEWKLYKVELPKKVQEEIFEYYREAIQDVEIEKGD